MKIRAKLPVSMMLLDGITVRKSLRTLLLGSEKLIPVSIVLSFELNPEHLAVLQNAEILGDDKGVKGTTFVEIDLQLSPEDERQVQSQHLANDLFIAVINDLIDVYRLRTNREWVERVTLKQVVQINVEYEHSNGFSFAGFPSIVTQHPAERAALVQGIKDAYESNRSLPIFIEYYLLSKKYFEASRYDLSVIFANIALESFVFLFSKLVHDDGQHSAVIAPTVCPHCRQQKFKTIREIFESIGTVVTLDIERISTLIRNVKRPSNSSLRNDITHGKIVFVDATSMHKANAELALQSLREIFDKSISAYHGLRNYL